jgi:hypothetical protein
MDINSLMPHDSNKIEKAKTAGLVSKWAKTGLLEGVSNEYDKTGIAVLLENQAKQLVTESSRTGTASNSEEWSGVALPLVRRIFAEIAAKDFVSVQPMNLPSGLVFFLDFKYGTSQPGFQSGAGKDSQNDSVFGVTDARKGTAAGTEGLYGAGRFGYSINEYTSSNLFMSTGSATVNSLSASLTATVTDVDWDYDSAFSASIVGNAAGTILKLTVASASLPSLDINGVRAFVPQNVTGTAIVSVFPAFTSYNSNTGNVTFLISGSNIVASSVLKVAYDKQPDSTTRGDFEDTKTQEGANLAIPEINLEMRSESIVAKTRKLKAIWTPEFAQDLNAYHSIDAEAELTSMLSEYISMEIDLEILDMLIQNAQTTERWSAQVGKIWDPATNAFINDPNLTGQAYNQGTWFQTLGTKLQKVSNTIHRLTLRGGANFLVCSPTVATILESIPGYAADTDGDKMQFAMGVQKVGAINSRFTVYKNPYMTENAILMGYRGAQFLETGAVYAPYIPLIMTPLVYDPTTFTPRKGVMTRYAKKIVRPEFYGKIYVDGLNKF